jgi:uncharacterized protein HemY
MMKFINALVLPPVVRSIPMNSDHNFTLWISNLVGGVTIVSTLTGMVPAIAAGVALVWYLIQINESATVQKWRNGRRVRKLAHLKAQALMLEAKLFQPETPNKLEN